LAPIEQTAYLHIPDDCNCNLGISSVKNVRTMLFCICKCVSEMVLGFFFFKCNYEGESESEFAVLIFGIAYFKL